LCATQLEPIGLVGRKIVLGDNFGEVSAPQRQEGALVARPAAFPDEIRSAASGPPASRASTKF